MNINLLTASKIKELRAKNNLTAEAVANMLKISKGAYSQLENGHTEITLSRVEALSQIFNVSLADIIPSSVVNNQTNNGDHGVNVSNSSAHTVNNFYTNEESLESIMQIIKSALQGKANPQ
ncbi:MAG: XRE family transcriptional regulator [Sphingobacteriales bacterium]|nr:MAG: XRE family transcriptional regulator [Sphingobacteriales bacterium]